MVFCSHCQEGFCSHSDLFRRIEFACRYTNKKVIRDLLLDLIIDDSFPFELIMYRPDPRYLCHRCGFMYDDLGSLAAHTEQSRSCPAHMKSEYFKKIIKTVNPPETEELLESPSVWG